MSLKKWMSQKGGKRKRVEVLRGLLGFVLKNQIEAEVRVRGMRMEKVKDFRARWGFGDVGLGFGDVGFGCCCCCCFDLCLRSEEDAIDGCFDKEDLVSEF